MGAKARNNFGLLSSCQHGSALLLYVKSSPLSKCLTKNNMASIRASTQAPCGAPPVTPVLARKDKRKGPADESRVVPGPKPPKYWPAQPQLPPLRFAPVGMTVLFARQGFLDETLPDLTE